MPYQLHRLNVLTRLVTVAVKATLYVFLTKAVANPVICQSVSDSTFLPGAPRVPKEYCVLKVPSLRPSLW